MILHIVSPSPFSQNALARCLSSRSEDDAVLLIEDATLALKNLAQCFGDGLPAGKLFALQPDLTARGITPLPHQDVTIVDYDGFVTLTIQYSKTISWF